MDGWEEEGEVREWREVREVLGETMRSTHPPGYPPSSGGYSGNSAGLVWSNPGLGRDQLASVEVSEDQQGVLIPLAYGVSLEFPQKQLSDETLNRSPDSL